jgi:uncharacterized membrane protein YoaK (UPF0700 family)
MLRKYNSSRSLGDNIKLGVITAFTAGMVNVASFILFFSFTSNVTGYFAILAEEISSGKWFQVTVVIGWIFLYMLGSFTSNFIVISMKSKYSYLSHVLPLVFELIIFIIVGVYGTYYYSETLLETEVLTSLLLFSMGLQNGLTASITNFSVKTTHLTGLATDLGIHLSMIMIPLYRNKQEVRNKIKLMCSIALSYLTGGIIAGSITLYFEFKVFFFIGLSIIFMICYDFFHLLFIRKHSRVNKYKSTNIPKSEDVDVQ